MRSNRIAILVSVMAFSCNDPRPTETAPQAEDHKDEPEHEELPTRIHIEASVADEAKIRTEVVRVGVLSRTTPLTGEVATNPNKTANVAPPVAGRIIDVGVQAGDKVQAGQVIATLRVADIARVRGESAAAAARAATTQANAARVQHLAEKGLASTQENLTAQSEAAAVSAEANALNEQVRALGADVRGNSDIVLRSPITGVVLSRTAVAGQPISTGQSIAEIADLSEVWFLARVFEKDLEHVTPGAQAEITLNAYPERRFAGVVDYVAQQIDPVARTVLARIRVTNGDLALRVGLFGVARIAVSNGEARPPALLVPRNAITDIGKKPVVFVRQADGDFERHEVTLGESALGITEVVQGLREGEHVVVDGVFTLKSIVLKSALADED